MATKRPDKYPTILISDKRKALPHAEKIEKETNLRTSVYDPRAAWGLPIFPNHRQSQNALQRLLDANPELSQQLDFRVLYTLTSMLEQSDVTPVSDDMEIYRLTGKHLYKLTVLGCRVRYKTQEALAKKLNRSRQHINEQIK